SRKATREARPGRRRGRRRLALPPASPHGGRTARRDRVGRRLRARARRGGVAGAPRRDRRGSLAVSAVDELGRRLVDVALLEGNFTLRSGRRSRWYLDKYRFETDPELLRSLGERLAAAIGTAEPGAARIAGPALGAVALAASAAMASGLPFIIVRGE